MAVIEHHLELPAHLGSVSDARQFVRERLALHGVAETAETALLLTSELVTNAIVHAAGGARLCITLEGGSVRVTVQDPSDALPHHREAAAGAMNGRGLTLVARLSQRWGVDDLGPGRGKTVWFEL